MPCIYKIFSISKPDRLYIGSAINFSKRKSRHSCDLLNNKHHSFKLQRHVNKYGFGDLCFELLELCNAEQLILREQFYIDLLNPYFNILKIAGHAFAENANFYGKKHTEESLKKMRGRKVSSEGIEKMKASKKNISDYTRLKMSNSQKNKKPISEITREKMRIAHLGNKRRLGCKASELEKLNKSKFMMGNTFRADFLKNKNL